MLRCKSSMDITNDMNTGNWPLVWLKTVLILCQFIVYTITSAVDVVDISRTTTLPMSIQGHKLNGFKYKVIYSVSSLTCSQRCLAEFPKCRSYNHLSTMGEFTCELNSKGISSMAEGLAGKLDKEPNSVFVQLQSESMDYPSTCADHYKSGKRVSGFYYVRDGNDNYYRVYCDMQSEPNKVYTLFTSYSFKNKNLPQFLSRAFFFNDPLKEDEPNWEYYRLSLTRMKYISTRSTHWRITCNFPHDGLKTVDYVRAKLSDVNLVTFEGAGLCRKMEYIHVINHDCSDCTAAWWQGSGGYMFHHDITANLCNFGATPGAVNSQDVFGFYSSVNTNFRCCTSETANTNYWFGSNV